MTSDWIGSNYETIHFATHKSSPQQLLCRLRKYTSEYPYICSYADCQRRLVKKGDFGAYQEVHKPKKSRLVKHERTHNISGAEWVPQL